MIKRATSADASLISKLSSITFSETFQGTCTDEDLQEFITQCFNESLVHKELQDLNDFYFIAFINSQATGYIRIKENVSDVQGILFAKGRGSPDEFCFTFCC